MSEVSTMSQAVSKLPDFEMCDFSDVNVKAGIIRMFDSEGDEMESIGLIEVFDYIESNELNQTAWYRNKSHDGNPSHDEEIPYEIPVLVYLKGNFQEVIKGFYNQKP